MIPKLNDLQLSLDEILAGGRLSFEVDGVGYNAADGAAGIGDDAAHRVRLFIRQPTVAERDEGSLAAAVARARLYQRPDIAELAQAPLPTHELAAIEAEIAETLKAMEGEEAPERVRWLRNQLAELYAAKKQTAAYDLVERQAETARRRFLAPRLLQDESGHRLAVDEAAWLALPPYVQDAATRKTAEMLRLMYVLPFSSAIVSERKP